MPVFNFNFKKANALGIYSLGSKIFNLTTLGGFEFKEPNYSKLCTEEEFKRREEAIKPHLSYNAAIWSLAGYKFNDSRHNFKLIPSTGAEFMATRSFVEGNTKAKLEPDADVTALAHKMLNYSPKFHGHYLNHASPSNITASFVVVDKKKQRAMMFNRNKGNLTANDLYSLGVTYAFE